MKSTPGSSNEAVVGSKTLLHNTSLMKMIIT